MPRPWQEYSLREWLRIKPLVKRRDYGRYQLRTYPHLFRPPARGDVQAAIELVRGHKLLVTIAFNDPEVIGWQTDLVARHVPEPVHLIVDNSSDSHASSEIENIARTVRLPYLKLDHGPWNSAPVGGRSHGLAISWVWCNLVLSARVQAVGFLDHDLFPLRHTDPFALVANYPAGGLVKVNDFGRWWLWAGFCFFRPADLPVRKLNFSLDWWAGLDTGGANWHRLYKHLDRAKIQSPPSKHIAIGQGLDVDFATCRGIGDWLHEGGTSVPLDLPSEHRALIRRKKRDFVRNYLIQATSQVE